MSVDDSFYYETIGNLSPIARTVDTVGERRQYHTEMLILTAARDFPDFIYIQQIVGNKNLHCFTELDCCLHDRYDQCLHFETVPSLYTQTILTPNSTQRPLVRTLRALIAVRACVANQETFYNSNVKARMYTECGIDLISHSQESGT